MENAGNQVTGAETLRAPDALGQTASATLLLAIERTYASWLRVSVWVFSLGVLGMNSNQLLAASDFARRIKAPIFLAGSALSLVAVVAIELFYSDYKQRIETLTADSPISSQRARYFTKLLQAVIVLSLAGSAWYGASEAVELN